MTQASTRVQTNSGARKGRHKACPHWALADRRARGLAQGPALPLGAGPCEEREQPAASTRDRNSAQRRYSFRGAFRGELPSQLWADGPTIRKSRERVERSGERKLLFLLTLNGWRNDFALVTAASSVGGLTRL